MILGTPEKRTIRLGDKDYNLSPINLNILADLTEEYGNGLAKLETAMRKKTFVTLRKLLFIFLQEEYPSMTLREVGKLVGVDDLDRVDKEIAELLKGQMNG